MRLDSARPRRAFVPLHIYISGGTYSRLLARSWLGRGDGGGGERERAFFILCLHHGMAFRRINNVVQLACVVVWCIAGLASWLACLLPAWYDYAGLHNAAPKKRAMLNVLGRSTYERNHRYINYCIIYVRMHDSCLRCCHYAAAATAAAT